MDETIETATTRERAALASERTFLSISVLLFAASVAALIYWSTDMAAGMVWSPMPGQSWIAAAASFMVMWMVMMLAMMLPSLAPELVRYRRSARGLLFNRLGGQTWLAALAYFVVWAVFGLVVYPLGAALASAEMQNMDLAAFAPLATAIVLLLGGALQLTNWKLRQLEHCRNMTVHGSGWRYGLHLGLHCSICCMGFMLALLAAGVMDLGFMALAAAAITLERLAPKPAFFARAFGVIMIIAGIIMIAW